MNITSKFVYVRKKVDFDPSNIPKNLNPIVFIEDSKEVWTCGTYFNIGYPSLNVTELDASVIVSLGDSELELSTTGDSLRIRKGTGNKIILEDTALTSINTISPIKWTTDKTLIHENSGVTAGFYGYLTSQSNLSILKIPSIKVNETGHITSLSNINVKIRDYVELLKPTSTSEDKNILLSYSSGELDETAQVRKANGLTYNDSTEVLSVKGGIDVSGPVNVDNGDLKVTNGFIVGNLKGDVLGQAVPKVHLSTTPEYGGASTKLYGHVLVQDDVPGVLPDKSSDNTSVSNVGVIAVAASPRMVYDALEQSKSYADNLFRSQSGIIIQGYNKEELIDLSKGFTFSTDFNVDGDTVLIDWQEIS